MGVMPNSRTRVIAQLLSSSLSFKHQSNSRRLHPGQLLASNKQVNSHADIRCYSGAHHLLPWHLRFKCYTSHQFYGPDVVHRNHEFYAIVDCLMNVYKLMNRICRIVAKSQSRSEVISEGGREAGPQNEYYSGNAALR